MEKVKILVLPVAGLGKRLLPLTKKTPKNLLRVCGKPLLEYVLEEAAPSGIRDVVLIVNPLHRKAFESYLREGRRKFPLLRFHIREQATPGGNGHAIAQARDILDGHPFAVRFCDDIVVDDPPVLNGLIGLFNSRQASVLLLERVPKKLVCRFGVVGVKKLKDFGSGPKGKIYRITKIIEKPQIKDAPSNLTIVGGYVVTPSVLRNLKSVADTLPIIADDALPLAVAFQIELLIGGNIYGWEFPGKRLDCGTLEKLRNTEKILRGFYKKNKTG